MTTLPVPVTTLHDLHAWMKALHSALFLVHNAMSAEELRKARDELVKLREPLDRKYKSPVDLHGGINQHIDDELVELSRVKRWTKKDLKHKRDFAKRCIDLLADMLMAQPFGYHEIYSPNSSTRLPSEGSKNVIGLIRCLSRSCSCITWSSKQPQPRPNSLARRKATDKATQK